MNRDVHDEEDNRHDITTQRIGYELGMFLLASFIGLVVSICSEYIKKHVSSQIKFVVAFVQLILVFFIILLVRKLFNNDVGELFNFAFLSNQQILRLSDFI